MRNCLLLAVASFIACVTLVTTWSQDTTLASVEAAEDDGLPGLSTYIVRRDDTLYTIAKRFNTSVRTLRSLNNWVDSRFLAEGQSLLVPQLNKSRVDSYEVKSGDSLYSIARQFGTTVSALQSLNGIGNSDYIVSGQLILLPKTVRPPFRPDFGFGIEIFADERNIEILVEQVALLGVNWVKLEVSWAEIEETESEFDFSELDHTIAALDARNVQILLNVHEAPSWTRTSYNATLSSRLRHFTGPPEDPNTFAAFMKELATRYAGVVDAYEIWKAPNLLKFWTVPIYDRPPKPGPDGDYGIPSRIEMGAIYYLELLRTAHDAIKSADRDALVITGGLAPVGFSDNYNSIETGTFLQDMLRGGVEGYSDGIGAIFGASAVPPTLYCCQRPPGVDTHYESFMQYFREVLKLYHDILRQNDAGQLPIYVTQVGWGTTEGSNLAIPSLGLEWLQYTDELEQALYTTQAFELAAGLDYIKGMFLYNLNGCAVSDREACFFSLIDANAAERPVLQAFQAIQKSAKDS